MAENVQINFGIKSDTKQAQSDIKALERALSSLQGVANQIGKGQSISNYGAQIKAAANEVADIRGKMQIASAMDKFVDNPNVENLYKFTRTVESEYNRVERAAKQTAKSVKQSNDEMGGSASRANGVFSNFFGSLTRIAKLRLLRGIIRMVTQAFREGTTNIYQYSAAMNNTDASGFSGQMNSLASSFLYLKNSIGAVVAPLLSSLVPALQTVIGWVTSALNVLAQFFAVLNGQSTYTKAKQVATEWQAVGSAAGGAAAAAKEYKNTIMSFDEIHALNDVSDGGGGGGGGGGTPDYGSMFEEAELATTGIAGAFNRLATAAKPIIGGIWRFTKNTVETALEGMGLGFDALMAVIHGDADEIRKVVDDMGKFVSKHPVLKGIYDGINSVRRFINNVISEVKLWLINLIEDFINLPFVSAILETLGFDVKTITQNLEDNKRKIQENKEEVNRSIRVWQLWSSGVDMATANSIANINQFSIDGIKAFAGIKTATDNSKKGINDTESAVWSLNNMNPGFLGIRQGFNDTGSSAWDVYSKILLVQKAINDLGKTQLNALTLGITAAIYKDGGYVTGFANGGIIPRFDGGGSTIDSASLFMAHENGAPELVGRIGSRTAVANQGQMVEAIAEGLSRALADMSDNGTSNIEVVVNMDGVAVARANDRGQKALNRRFNVSLA